MKMSPAAPVHSLQLDKRQRAAGLGAEVSARGAEGEGTGSLSQPVVHSTQSTKTGRGGGWSREQSWGMHQKPLFPSPPFHPTKRKSEGQQGLLPPAPSMASTPRTEHLVPAHHVGFLGEMFCAM